MKKITFEFVASNTSAQNNHSERLKNILIIKTRAMRLQVELFIYLWLWINQTSEYFINRIFNITHVWKTSFELTIDKKLNLTHLIQYESKIYSVDKAIFKREKMRSRTHIDFLVEYDNTNIYLIWISNQRKVIKIQDVIFDENSNYISHKFDATQLLFESFILNDTLNIFQNKFIKIMKIEFDNEKNLFKLTSIDIILDYQIHHEKAEKQISNDVSEEYLSSSSSFQQNDATSTTTNDIFIFSTRLKSSSEQSLNIESELSFRSSSHYSNILLNENNILSKEFTRKRIRNSRR